MALNRSKGEPSPKEADFGGQCAALDFEMRLWPGKMSTRLTLASPSFWTKVCASWLVSPPGAKDPASYIAKAIEPVLHWANLSRRPGDPWLSRWRARCQCRQSTSLAILAQASVNPSARLSTALTSFLGRGLRGYRDLHALINLSSHST